MSDDSTGRENPPGPPQWPPTEPLFVQHGQPVTVPPPQQPPRQAGGLPQHTGADAWPWYYSLAAFISGFVFSQILIGILYAAWLGAGGKPDDDTWFLVIASGINSMVFVVAAVTIAGMSGPVSARDFGLVRAPLGQAVGKSVAILASYFILLAVYNELVSLAPDDAAEKLGANSGALGMLAFAILVAVIAPIAEEIFYRGMVFRALANGVGVWLGAIISGVLFGAVHIDSLGSERLLQVVPLGLLGIFFAVLYFWSGTLFAPIALHATNNALAVAAFANDQDSTIGLVAIGIIWPLMMLLCVFGPRLTDRQEPPPPPSAPFFANPERPAQYSPPS